jgi:proton glutamate symport protein
MQKLKRPVITGFFIFLTITAVLHFLDLAAGVAISPVLLAVSRIAAVIFLVLYAVTRNSLTAYILVSMVVGAEVGHDFPAFAINLNILSKIFLNMIKTIIAPLLFGTLVVGIAGHPDLKQVGRMGWKSIVYFEVVSTIALFIGLAAINISGAGLGVQMPVDPATANVPAIQKQTWQEIILHVFPENIAKSIFEGNVLQIVVFSIIFGVAVALVKEKYRRPMVSFAESLSEVMFKFTNIIMYFAPVAVFAAIAYSVGHMGLSILVNLFKMLATLYVALIVFILGVFFPIMLIFKIPVRRFFRAVSEPATIAFATTSSESALPVAMENMEKFGVPRKIVAFVLPTGYSFNLDGTTLYLSLATIFVAQVAGIHLSFDKQLIIVFTLMLTSKGVAGVPRASLVILMATATNFGLPILPIFIILGIDELMDMARTAVNVIGNCLASAVIARWEGELEVGS